MQVVTLHKDADIAAINSGLSSRLKATTDENDIHMMKSGEFLNTLIHTINPYIQTEGLQTCPLFEDVKLGQIMFAYLSTEDFVCFYTVFRVDFSSNAIWSSHQLLTLKQGKNSNGYVDLIVLIFVMRNIESPINI